MSAAMVVNDDVHAVPAQAAVLGLVAVLCGCLAAWVFRPLLRPRSDPPMPSGDDRR